MRTSMMLNFRHRTTQPPRDRSNLGPMTSHSKSSPPIHVDFQASFFSSKSSSFCHSLLLRDCFAAEELSELRGGLAFLAIMIIYKVRYSPCAEGFAPLDFIHSTTS